MRRYFLFDHACLAECCRTCRVYTVNVRWRALLVTLARRLVACMHRNEERTTCAAASSPIIRSIWCSGRYLCEARVFASN